MKPTALTRPKSRNASRSPVSSNSSKNLIITTTNTTKKNYYIKMKIMDLARLEPKTKRKLLQPLLAR